MSFLELIQHYLNCLLSFSQIRTPDRIWYLAAESEAERTTWIEALETSVTVLCKDVRV